ncbi:MAG TPA: TlpA disulfide reductase family protein, partial [Pirellulaceae bacterium]|nr:TlpA disulfide reductase family protein [Pirellulaceae bacterium]
IGDSPGSRGATANRGATGGGSAGGDDLDATPPAAPKSNAAAKAAGKKSEAEGKSSEGGDAAADGIQVPDAPPEELLKALANLERREPTGRNNRELVDNLRQWMAARLAIAEKILSIEATPKQRVTAARAKRDVLIQMTQIGLPDTQKQMRSFCAELLADAAPEMVRLGRITQLNLQLAMLIAGATEDTKDLLESFDVALEDPTKDEELFQAVTGVAITLQQAGMNEQAQKAYKGIIGAFGEVKNERIALMVGQLAELSKLIDVGLDKKREAVLTGEPNANEELLGAVRQLLSDKPGPATLERLSALAQDFEFNRNYDLSGQIYTSIGEAYKSHEDKEIAERAGKMIVGGQKRAALVGKPLAIDGKLLDGKPFDWKQYEGKIVLVDFWATWCAPCRAEIPNIKRNFDKYHDKGFEVVGINLDRDRGEVDRFFGAQTLPWATVVGADDFANHCGVESIPFVMLVGRDGRVIDLHVRGELLGKKLTEIFDGAGDAEDKGDSKPDSKPDAKTKPLSKEVGKA